MLVLVIGADSVGWLVDATPDFGQLICRHASVRVALRYHREQNLFERVLAQAQAQSHGFQTVQLRGVLTERHATSSAPFRELGRSIRTLVKALESTTRPFWS